MAKIIVTTFFLFISSFALAVNTSKYLNNGEELIYKGNAPRFIIFGNLGTITLKTKKDKLVNKKDAFKLELGLELDENLSGLYAYGSKMNSVVGHDVFKSLIYNKTDAKSDQKRFEKVIFDYEGKEIWYKRYRDAEKKKYDVHKMEQTSILDPLSLIYYLRTFNFPKKNGSTKSIHVFNRGKVLKMSIVYSKTEIKVKGKKRKVIHIKPSKATKGALIRKRDVELFLDPKTKIPLLIRILGFPVVGRLELYLNKSNHPHLKM